MRSSQEFPHKVFGEHLKTLRQRANESLLEVSGAVEIDEAMLQDIETGKNLPDEEILVLLMSHFDVKDQDAVRLWELAGYSRQDSDSIIDEQSIKQIMMVLPIDNKVLYSDTARISANNKGVVINFGLSADNKQPQMLSRVGMSLDQAELLAKRLMKSINLAKQPKIIRALPDPKLKPEKKKRP